MRTWRCGPFLPKPQQVSNSMMLRQRSCRLGSKPQGTECQQGLAKGPSVAPAQESGHSTSGTIHSALPHARRRQSRQLVNISTPIDVLQQIIPSKLVRNQGAKPACRRETQSRPTADGNPSPSRSSTYRNQNSPTCWRSTATYAVDPLAGRLTPTNLLRL